MSQLSITPDMDDQNKLDLLVVGCGKWGTNIIKTAHAMQCLAAVVDSNSSSFDKLKERFPSIEGTSMYESLSEAMDKHKLAAVVVATPPSTHFKVAKHALSHGRHVFVEKPICDSTADARKLVTEARRRGCILMVDHLLQYSLPHRRLLHLVSTGYVGDVKRVRMRRVNFGTIRTVEDVLWSFCPHDLSILLALLRGPSSSSSKAPNNVESKPAVHATSIACHGQFTVSDRISDYVNLFINFSSGAHAHVEASWLHPLKERQVVVYGTEGSIILNEAMPDPNLPSIQVYKWSAKRRADGTAVDAKISQHQLDKYLREHPETESVAFSSDSQPLRSALEHFLDCAKNSITPRTDGEEALRVLTLLNAASESIVNNGSVVPINNHSLHTDHSSNGNPASAEKKTPLNGTKQASFIHGSAILDDGAIVGQGTKIWHFSHVMGGARIGRDCNIGQNVFIGGKAVLGHGVKVQNNVSIYDAVKIDDNVFLGPSCVLTNVKTPRSHISRKHEFLSTHVKQGVTVGANATIVCGVTLGEFSFIGAGAVVTKDVPAHSLVYGNPATIHGWVSTTGVRLVSEDNETLKCPESNETYRLSREGDHEFLTKL